jgi:hypothetical protein
MATVKIGCDRDERAAVVLETLCLFGYPKHETLLVEDFGGRR